MQKLYFSILAAAAIAAMPAAAQVTPSATNVFQNKVLASCYDFADEVIFAYNDAYQLVSAQTSASSYAQESITFEYAPGTINGYPYDVKMTVVESFYTEDFYITLDANGFASSIYYLETEGATTETGTMTIEYNADGQMVKFSDTHDAITEVTNITWQDGNIVKTVHTEPGEPASTYTISYGTTPVPNTARLMMYDMTFGIDVDNAGFLYFAGMLGTPTQYLPANVNDDGEASTYTWKLDAEGYPVSVSEGDDIEYIFTWKAIEGAGIGAVEADACQAPEYYDITGVRHDAPAKGLNIVRANGVVKKVIIP